LWIPVAPSFLRTVLAGSDRALGYQLALFGIGGLLGSLAAPSIVRRWGQGPVFSTMLLGEAAAMLAYSQTTVLAWSNAIILAWGAIVSLMLVPYYSLIQTRVAEDYLGRVCAVARQSEHLATVLAIGVAVALQTRLGPQQIFLAAACMYLVLAAAALRIPSGRELLRSV
jgi:predicted MFS family arabinose efflux permease